MSTREYLYIPSTNMPDIYLAYRTLQDFPLYFGDNLDALYDALTDPDWIYDRNIYIVHDARTYYPPQYMQVLQDAVDAGSRICFTFPLEASI
jgi:RNAse (barnase) inhibitor barstar